MWMLLIIMGVLIYFGLLACLLTFFAAVAKMNRHWERVFRETRFVRGDDRRRAA